MELQKKDQSAGVDRVLARDVAIQASLGLLLTTLVLDYYFGWTLNHRFGNWFYIIPITAALLAIIHFVPKLKDAVWLRSNSLFLLVVFNLSTMVTFVFFAPITGPYVLLLAATAFMTIYYRGFFGYLATVFSQLFIITAAYFASYSTSNALSLKSSIIFAIVDIVYCTIIWRVSITDNAAQDEINTALTQLNLERERLLSLINGMIDAVIFTDTKGIILLQNGATARLLNSTTPIVNQSIFNVLKLSDGRNQPVDISTLINHSTGLVARNDLHFISNIAEQVNLDIRISAIHDANSKHQRGYTWVLRDITKEKTLDEQRDEFVSVVSHEIRTPIAIAEAGISTAIHTTTNLGETQKKLLNDAHENVMRLGDIVKDLSTLTRIEAQKVQFIVAPLFAQNMLAKLLQANQAAATQKNIHIQIMPQITQRELITSGLHVEEILQNLVSNAVKYTAEGGLVELGAHDSEAGVLFIVKDNGMGISPTDQAKIFTKFFRVEDYKTKHSRGTGLGLYISQRLAQRIGAKLWFSSELKKGSTFYLQVPSIVQDSGVQSQIHDTELQEYASGI